LVLAGDVNSRGDNTGTATYALLRGPGGFDDAWSAVHPGNPGYTWGQDADLRNPASKLSERLDFVLMRGDVAAKSADVLGDEMDDKTAGGLWPSDHAGVAATLVLHPRTESHATPFSSAPISKKKDAAREAVFA
jgi:endonuclease/exonuclease/phosphatase family metal-dependent hydrolase